MNDLEKIILEEISTLDELRLIDVIGFIRYLKEEKPVKQEWITGWYESALQSIHEQRNGVLAAVSTPKEPARKKQGQ